MKSKISFNKISKEVYNFEKKVGFDKTSKAQLVKWLKKEVKNYEKTNSKSVKQNKLIDIMVLVFQISRREGMSIDSCWKKWWIDSKKYLKD